MNDETLKEQIEITVGTFISLKYDVDTDEFADGTLERWNDMTKDIMQLIIQARIDELKQLWNSTQPDIVPEGVPAEDMSEELHKRIEKLRSEL